MSVLVSLYHAVFTFHTALLPTSVHYLGQVGKTGILILLPQRFFERFSQTLTPLPGNFPIRNLQLSFKNVLFAVLDDA